MDIGVEKEDRVDLIQRMESLGVPEEEKAEEAMEAKRVMEEKREAG